MKTGDAVRTTAVRLLVSATAFMGIVVVLAALVHAQAFDLVIANGRVVGPKSGLNAVRNVGRTIAAISADRLNGRTVIDASGLVVSPGFIDLHAHGQTPETYRFQARDGATTALELEVGSGDIVAGYGARKSGTLINGPLGPGVARADADGRNSKDDAHARAAPRGTSASDARKRASAGGRRRRHHDFRCCDDHRSLDLR